MFAIVSIVVLVVCVRWAVHTEHRLRTWHPAAAGDERWGPPLAWAPNWTLP